MREKGEMEARASGWCILGLPPQNTAVLTSESPWAPCQRVWSLEASFSGLQMAVFLLGSYTIFPLPVSVPSVSPCGCKCPLLTRRRKWQLIPGKSQGEKPGGLLSIRSQSWTPRSYGTHTTPKDAS